MEARQHEIRSGSGGRRTSIAAAILIGGLLPVVLLASPAAAAPGNLDTSFDTDGKVITDFPALEQVAFDVVVQPDGKIVAVGAAEAATGEDAVLVRYNADGSLDTSFDGDGKVTTAFGSGIDEARSVALQPDGKIVVAGTTSQPTWDLVVARYTSTGALDTSFDGDGKVILDVTGGREVAESVAIQADGKIVVAGSRAVGDFPTLVFLVARFDAGGTADVTFDGDGIVTTDIGPSADEASSLVVLPEGKLVVAGTVAAMPGTSDDFGVVRYNLNGSLDTTFDADGKVTVDFSSGPDEAHAVVAQIDGKVVVAGIVELATRDFGLARLDLNGGLDMSFDTDGKVTTDLYGGDDYGFDIGLQADGRLVMVGDSDPPADGFSVVRYTTAGALDSSFDADGKNVADFSSEDDGAYAMAFQPDGKIVAVGFTSSASGGIGVARFQNDPGISIGDVSVTEGNAGTTAATFTVALSAASTLPVTVQYTVANGTAITGSDFTATPIGTLTFSPGDTTEQIVVNVTGDTTVEPDETFFLNLRSPTNVSVLDTQARGVIKNDDVPPAGYWLVASDGGIFAFGVAFHGSTGALRLNRPIVGMSSTPSGKGYWLVASDGGIFAFGDAGFKGSTGALTLNRPIVGMAATPSGNGYWLVASDGGIFAFGDAVFRGSTGAIRLAQPIVGMASTPSGNGYLLVASDGGIFAFGDAVFRGSTGAIRLAQPVVGMAATPSGNGYWLVASDGGVFAFGDAVFYGSTGAIRLNKPVRGMESTPSGKGYWLVATDGGTFAFGDAVFKGSTGAITLNQPMVGMAAP